MVGKIFSKLWSPWTGGIILCLLAGVAKDMNMVGTSFACGMTGGFLLFGLAIKWFVDNV